MKKELLYIIKYKKTLKYSAVPVERSSDGLYNILNYNKT